MECKNCGEEVEKLGYFWIHIGKYSKYYHCCVVINNISSNLRAEPIAEPIEEIIEEPIEEIIEEPKEYEINDDFMEMLKAL